MRNLSKLKFTKRVLAIFVVAILVFTLLPQHSANASILDYIPTWVVGKFVGGQLIKNIGEFITGFLLQMVGSLIQAFAFVLDKFIALQTKGGIFDLQVVRIGWTVMKNFVNLIFVLILVVIAFATLFDKPKYAAKSLLIRVIIIALLVNFSLLVGQTVISTADFLSGIFLKDIQNSGENLGADAISSSLMKGLGLQKSVADEGINFLTEPIKAGTEITVTVVFVILLFIIVLFAFLLIAIFVVVRIPILWILLMLSPLAWFAWILPNTQKFWSMWWKEFIGWSFFTPVYLFILMFGIGFINAESQIKALLPQGGESLIEKLGYDTVFMYIVTLIFIGGGLWAARKVSFIAGTGAVAAANWSGNMLKRAPVFGRGQSYASLKKGVMDTKGRIAKEGLPGGLNKIYGGEKALDKAGVSSGSALQRAMGYNMKEADKKRLADQKKIFTVKVEKMTSQEQEAFLRQQMQSTSKFEQVAAGELLNEAKKLNVADQIAHYNNLGGDTSEEARQFASKINFSAPGWDSERRRVFYNTVNDAKVKGNIINAAAKAGDLLESSEQQLAQFSTLFSTMDEQLKFLDAAQSKFSTAKDKSMREEMSRNDGELANLKQRTERANEINKAQKKATDDQLNADKADLDRQFAAKAITEAEMNDRKQKLAEQAKQAKAVADGNWKNELDTIVEDTKKRNEQLEVKVRMANPAFKVKFDDKLVRDGAGKIITDAAEAVKEDTNRINKTKHDQDLGKMFEKIGEELKKQDKGKAPEAEPKPEEPKK